MKKLLKQLTERWNKLNKHVQYILIGLAWPLSMYLFLCTWVGPVVFVLGFAWLIGYLLLGQLKSRS